jgi:hypothetical protein
LSWRGRIANRRSTLPIYRNATGALMGCPAALKI